MYKSVLRGSKFKDAVPIQTIQYIINTSNILLILLISFLTRISGLERPNRREGSLLFHKEDRGQRECAILSVQSRGNLHT